MQAGLTRSKQLCFAIAMVCSSSVADAYQVATHEVLSRLAVERSVLANSSEGPLFALGVEDLGATYASIPPAGEESERVTALGLVALGSRYEDLPEFAWTWPPSDFRFLRHFFDPQQGGIGLTVPPLAMAPSPDWVLEDVAEDPAQEFSVRDAMDFYKSALIWPGKDFRDDSLIELLQTLGRSIHHIQDMAQPAHTRNDPHVPRVDGDPYESYTNRQFVERRRPVPFVEIYGPDGLDLSRFASARDFWIGQGAGIAEFTGDNFVSKDTNFRYGGGVLSADPLHPNPSPGEVFEHQTLQQLGVPNPAFPNALVSFIGNWVVDAYSNTTEYNQRASTLSIFGPDLASVQFSASTSLNRFNFEAGYPLLFSRAIAYSAGLINYFFRGELTLENLVVNGASMQLTIKNTSAAQLALSDSELQTEEFSIHYDAADGLRKRLALSAEDLAGDSLEHGATRTLTFARPIDLDSSKRMPFVLVFDGTIGSERGIAALAFGDGGGSLLVTPNYTPADGITGPRVIKWNGNRWILTTETGKVAGGVDWKGHGTDVLTWGSSVARYLNPANGPVYKDGRQLTTGPAGVSGKILGASIRTVDGVRVLNVVKNFDTSLRIFSRLYADVYPNEGWWAEDNPLGWREVYSGTPGAAFTGFFFNQSGTEGQYITMPPSLFRPHERIKIRLTGYTASVTTYPAVATIRRSSGTAVTREPTTEIAHGTCAASGQVVAVPGDSCSRRSYVNNWLETNRSRTIELYSDRTIFCVDYKGDKEVFCELLSPEDDALHLGTATTQTVRDIYDRGASSCGVERDISDYRYYSLSNTRSLRNLKVGSKSVPWTGSLTAIFSERNNRGDRLVANSFSGRRASGTDSELMGTSRLMYMDARYDFIMYQTRFSTTVQRSEGQFSAMRPGGGSYTSTDSQTIERRNVATVDKGGAQTVMFEHETTTTTGGPTTLQTGSLQVSIWPCDENPSGWDPFPTTTLLDPAASPNFLTDASGRVAITGEGHWAASPFVYISGIGGPPGNNSYWLHLQGGDLATLIPSAQPVAFREYTFKVLQ